MSLPEEGIKNDRDSFDDTFTSVYMWNYSTVDSNNRLSVTSRIAAQFEGLFRLSLDENKQINKQIITFGHIKPNKEGDHFVKASVM